MLENIFKKIGLKNVHAQVYMQLLDSVSLPAGKLAKIMNLNRQSIYEYLRDLANVGLVTQSEKQGVKIWQASSPDKLQKILVDQISQIETINKSLTDILPDLKAKQKVDFITPKFTYYEGGEGVRQIFKDVMLYRDIETLAFWPVKDMVEVVGRDFLEKYVTKERLKRNISVKFIAPENKMVDIKKYPFFGSNAKLKRKVRIAPHNIHYSMGYWIYGNKVAFISSKKESFGFIVESKEMVQLQKNQFEVMWNLSKKIETSDSVIEKFITENII
jgi:HTH-type transcriptional regulator, sugar sensing transcriptional regulator